MHRGAHRDGKGVREAQGRRACKLPSPFPLPHRPFRLHPTRDAPCPVLAARPCLPSGLGARAERARDTPSSAVALIVARWSEQAPGGAADSGLLSPFSRLASR